VTIYPENLPAELRETGLFCCWRYEKRGGKLTKVPYNPRTNDKAQSNSPASFAPLSVALAAMESGKYDGIGVGVFGNLGAIDIDDCISEAGDLSDMALDIVDTMAAYTEYSPSRKGLRILCKVPEGFQYDKDRFYVNNQKAGLEVYIAGATKKFVTVTGDRFTNCPELEWRGDELLAVRDTYMLRLRRSALPSAAVPAKPVALSDKELLAKAMQNQHRSRRPDGSEGATFAELWEGDISRYSSASEADQALCNWLAFWTGRDPERIDRLFRQSGLMRDKWDEVHGADTYETITIMNAISTMTGPGYDPDAYFRKLADDFITETPTGPLKLADLHPEKNSRYAWNDIGNGNLFADWYKNIARYSPERKKWYVYDGRVWKPDAGNLRAMELCKKLADGLVIYALGLPDGDTRDAYRKYVERWQVRRNRETILKDAASVHPVMMADFDKAPHLYNCRNGTLDLQTGEFRPHSPADMLTQLAGVSYDPDARSPLWEKCVADAMQGDVEKSAYLQKSFGYGLTGEAQEECLFLLYGYTTRNGKGTIMETYRTMQGDYGRAARPETLAQKDRVDSRSPSEDLARLAGARMVNISEPGKQMVLSAELVKTLTGRDTINARFLHEDSFEFSPQFKIFINTNHLPKVTDSTVFTSGRVKVIPFERHFTEAEQDKQLKKKLRKAASLSGVLNWCLEGLRMFQETGLDMPPSVLEATEQYRKKSDKIARFVEEMMEPDPLGEIRTVEAYDAYQNWCARNGQYPESLENFKTDMSAHAEVKRKRPAGAGREANPLWYILGIKWRCVQGCADLPV